MTTTASEPPIIEEPWHAHPVVRTLFLLALLYLFLVGVNALGGGFKSLGSGVLDSFFSATKNPFVGLMVGILATTLVQSSSVTTATIVGLVAAPLNPLPIANAVPMIMGANIGTTVTNTIASLAHLRRKEEFRRAFAVATCHDFFNYLIVIILLPVELFTGFLAKSAAALAGMLSGVGGADFDSPFKAAIKAGTKPIKGVADTIASGGGFGAWIEIVIAGGLIVISLTLIVRVMRSSMKARVEGLVTRALGKNPVVAMAIGAVSTVMVQSSSITTSLLVPLAGAGVLKLRQAFPVTLGANIGTTITGLLAAMAVTEGAMAAGLTIALVHLLFNLVGTLLVYPFVPIRELPLRAAESLADLAVRSKKTAITYVVLLFYVLPAALAVLNRFIG